jgi:Raf kinase inhibitor-like YbhB/YbcL family protein
MYKQLLGLLMVTISTNAQFILTSTVITDGKPLPRTAGLEVGNKAPDLSWSNAPKGTKSFTLICDDPDAPTKTPWVHWVVFNVPGSSTSMPPMEREKEKNGVRQGTSTFKEIGYDGPQPPGSETHRYYFTLYALDTVIDLPGGATKEQLLDSMKNHILGKAQLMGTYKS